MTNGTRQIILVAAGIGLLSGAQGLADGTVRPRTFCNPIDIPYRFQKDQPSRREAADPTVVLYRGEYWLFPSKSEGYWHSRDFVNWQFVEPTGLPIDNYAPTVMEFGGKLYWTAFEAGIYVTDDPVGGNWKQVSTISTGGDPDLFLDDDGRVYLYHGCSDGGPIIGQELDPKDNMKPIGGAKPLIKAEVAGHGWEIHAQPDAAGPYNPTECWFEGAWMTKHGGRYYLQYAAPGTEFKSYADGVYVGDSPLGPFTYAPYSPLSLKPGGFINGAGHGSTFQDLHGHYWHIATMTISVRHMFERRLGLFPAWFERDGQMACDTAFGDYPQFLPGVTSVTQGASSPTGVESVTQGASSPTGVVTRDPSKGNSPGWMLLSYRKSATASSTLDGHPVENAVDENVRTWWSAKTGDPGEWLQVDLGKRCRVDAIQVNFADEGSTQIGRLNDGYGYTLDVSEDGSHWTSAIDRRDDRRDSPHDYTELPKPVLARYVRITNSHMPAGARFSLSGLRLFGSGLCHSPGAAHDVGVVRDQSDARQATIKWKAADGADGYVVRYGIARDRLFNSYQVFGASTLHIHALNAGVPYYFAVDTFNDSGVTRGSNVVEAQ